MRVSQVRLWAIGVHPTRERLLKVLLDSLVQVGVQTAFKMLKSFHDMVFLLVSSLSISLPPVISPCIGPSEQLNPRSGISMRGVASDVFPPSSVTRIAESSSRIFGVRGNVGHHESVRFNLPSTGNVINHSDVCSPLQPSRPLSFTDSLDLRPTTIVAPNSNDPPNQSYSMHILDLPRNTLSFPCNGTLNSGAGGSSSSS
ncbi:hypothetical protein CsSME_00009622 [Camellia sinensis var. sinensis]